MVRLNRRFGRLSLSVLVFILMLTFIKIQGYQEIKHWIKSTTGDNISHESSRMSILDDIIQRLDLKPERAGLSPSMEEVDWKERSEGQGDNNKMRAAMVLTISNNYEYSNLLDTIQSYQSRFNSKFGYDWVVITYRNMAMDFRSDVVNSVGPGCSVEFIELKYRGYMISYPRGIDRAKVSVNMKAVSIPTKLKNRKTFSGRHFTRFALGHLYNLDVLWNKYDYMWRVPVGSSLDGFLRYDPFRYMHENGIKYGWSLMQKEFPELHPTLMKSVKDYVLDPQNNFLDPVDGSRGNIKFLVENYEDIQREDNTQIDWNMRDCSIYSEFELVDLSFFRSKQYRHFFNYLDDIKGIYYETWTEPVIKTTALSLFLASHEVKFFHDIPVTVFNQGLSNCPTDLDVFTSLRATCDASAVKALRNMEYEHMYNSKCVSNWIEHSYWDDPFSFRNKSPILSFLD